MATYVQNDVNDDFKLGEKAPDSEWRISKYYDTWEAIYKKLYGLKIGRKILNKRNDSKFSESKSKSTNNKNNLIKNNTNKLNLVKGGSLHKTKKNIQIGGKKKEEKSRCVSTGFDSFIFNTGIVQLGRPFSFDIKKNVYADLNIHFTFRDINRTFRYTMRHPPTLQSDKNLNLSLFIQAFYVLVRQNSNKTHVLDSKKIRKNVDLYEIMMYKKIHNLFIANFDLGLTFPLVVENIYGVNHIFCDTINTRSSYPTPFHVKAVHDDDDDYKAKEKLKMVDYPLATINQNGEIEITSISKSGKLKIKRTYLGEYYFHTFINFFFTHPVNHSTKSKDVETDKQKKLAIKPSNNSGLSEGNTSSKKDSWYQESAVNNSLVSEEKVRQEINTKKQFIKPKNNSHFSNSDISGLKGGSIKLLEYKNMPINLDAIHNKLESVMLPVFICDRLSSEPKTFLIDYIYFIHLWSDIFLIFDIKSFGFDCRPSYYIGHLPQWLGYFWDRK
jgi:hypothetical protein